MAVGKSAAIWGAGVGDVIGTSGPCVATRSPGAQPQPDDAARVGNVSHVSGLMNPLDAAISRFAQVTDSWPGIIVTSAPGLPTSRPEPQAEHTGNGLIPAGCPVGSGVGAGVTSIGAGDGTGVGGRVSVGARVRAQPQFTVKRGDCSQISGGMKPNSPAIW